MDNPVFRYLGYKYENGCVYNLHEKVLVEIPDWFQEILLERHPLRAEFEHMVFEILETNNWRK